MYTFFIFAMKMIKFLEIQLKNAKSNNLKQKNMKQTQKIIKVFNQEEN